MILHHRSYLLLTIIWYVQLINCVEKGKIALSDDSSEYENDYSSSYQSKDPFAVEFPKENSNAMNSYEDNSYEKNKYDFDRPSYSSFSAPYQNSLTFNPPYKNPSNDYYPMPNYDQYGMDKNPYKKPQEFEFNLDDFNRKPIDSNRPSNNLYDDQFHLPTTNRPPYPSTSSLVDDNLNLKLTCYDQEHTCVSLSKCPLTRFDDLESIQKCTLSYDSDFGVGICCPPPDYPTNRQPPNNLPISRKATKSVYPSKLKYYPNVNKNNGRSLNDNYDERIRYVKQIERALVDRKLLPAKNSPEAFHINFFGNNKEAQTLGRKGERSIHKAIEMVRNYYNNYATPTKNMYNLMASTTIDPKAANASECPTIPICSSFQKYRTADGSCNNLLYPNWGKAFTPYNRVLNPDYGDGINSPRLSKTKEQLANPRDLSVELTRNRYPPESKKTLLTMQFGQFVDHDFASAAPTRTEKGEPISCCKPEIQADPTNLKHPSCYEIPISKDDPFFRKFNITCMNFVRSIATPRADCKLAPREQLNQPTAYLDCSQVYGSSQATENSLRTFKDGQMISSLFNNYQYLPPQLNGTCNVPGNDPKQCFRAGDPRVNENVDMTVLQTVFMREHNRIAKTLKYMNPKFTDEKCYQEAKRINSAQMQHITYNEFLPALLNRYTMKEFDLYVTEEGFIKKYDPKINPQLFSAFATAAYRCHSTIQGFIQVRNRKAQLIGEIRLSDTFNRPYILTEYGMMDGLIMGITSQPMQSMDRYFTTAVTDELFRPWNETAGLDIYSLNVQRGRDHGLKGYTAWRKQCGLPKIKNFEDLDLVMPRESIKILRRHYKSVHDIDLYTAGILEHHLENGEVGPTFSCLIGEQFRRTKYGDRFWYENANLPNSFTPEQLAEIKKASMARIFCDNGDHIEMIQPHAFILPIYFWNQRVSCDNTDRIPRLSLLPWSELSYK